MIEVLTHLGKYVPTVSTENTVLIHGEEPVKLTEDSFHAIALGKFFIYIIYYAFCISSVLN